MKKKSGYLCWRNQKVLTTTFSNLYKETFSRSQARRAETYLLNSSRRSVTAKVWALDHHFLQFLRDWIHINLEDLADGWCSAGPMPAQNTARSWKGTLVSITDLFSEMTVNQFYHLIKKEYKYLLENIGMKRSQTVLPIDLFFFAWNLPGNTFRSQHTRCMYCTRQRNR